MEFHNFLIFIRETFLFLISLYSTKLKIIYHYDNQPLSHAIFVNKTKLTKHKYSNKLEKRSFAPRVLNNIFDAQTRI